MPPPPKPPPGKYAPTPKVAAPVELTPKGKLEKLAQSGYVDVNDAARFIGEIKEKKPERGLLRELKLTLIRHQSVFDRGAFQKIRAFCETYKAEDDID